MKSKILQGITIAFLTTLAIYTLIKNEIISFPEGFSLRFLFFKSSKDSIDKMCSKSSSDLVQFYKQTEPGYNYIPPEGSETLVKIAKDLISGSSDSIGGEQIKDYFFENATTIFVLVLFIFLILFWIPFCSCICCKCCLCAPQLLMKYAKFILYACLLLCLAIVIVCIIGFTQNTSILNGVYGFGCSLLKIGHHLVYGDDYTLKKPYWMGVTTIIYKLNETKTNISELLYYTKDLDENLDNIKDMFITFQNNLNEEYDIRKKSEITNPIPDQDNNTIIPEYLNKYGPTDDINTTLGIIQYELSTFEPFTLGPIGDIIDIIALDKNTTDTISNFLNDIVNSVDKNIKDIDDQIGNVIKDFDSTLDEVNNISLLVMNSLFAINLSLIVLLSITLSIFYFSKKCHCLLCFSWSLLYIFMLGSLVIAALFLVLGLFLQNLSYGVSNIVHNIKAIKTSSTFSDIALNVIDVCFNGKGLLSESDIFPKEFNTTIVENIYSIEQNYKQQIIEIQDYQFVSTEIAEEKYDDFQNKPKKYINNLVISLNDIQTYIDISVNNTKVSEETPFYDEWEINKDDCKEGYDYLPANSTNMMGLLEEKKSCLVIIEWGKEEILERYKNFLLLIL